MEKKRRHHKPKNRFNQPERKEIIKIEVEPPKEVIIQTPVLSDSEEKVQDKNNTTISNNKLKKAG